MNDYSSENTTFNVSGIDHPRIEKYRPEFIAAGGQQIVFSLPDYPDKVVKVDGRDLLSALKNRHYSYNDTEEEREKAFSENIRFQQLAAYFGRDHVLSQKTHLLKVPVDRKLAREVCIEFGQNIEELPEEIEQDKKHEVWTLVTLQEKSLEISSSQSLGLTAGIAELRPQLNPDFARAYNQITQQTIFDLQDTHPLEIDGLVEVQRYLQNLISAALINPELKKVLADFTQKSLQYTNDTGEILDFAGLDNIIFFPDSQGHWQYLLTDALFPANGHEMITEAKDTLVELAQNGALDIDHVETIVLKNTLNYVRTVNGLAQWLGLDSRIDLISPLAKQLTPEQIFSLIRFKARY